MFLQNKGAYKVKPYNMSLWGDFWESELTDRKFLKCHFGEISALQYMSFWGDFSTSIYVILGRFRGKNKNNET